MLEHCWKRKKKEEKTQKKREIATESEIMKFLKKSVDI